MISHLCDSSGIQLVMPATFSDRLKGTPRFLELSSGQLPPFWYSALPTSSPLRVCSPSSAQQDSAWHSFSLCLRAQTWDNCRVCWVGFSSLSNHSSVLITQWLKIFILHILFLGPEDMLRIRQSVLAYGISFRMLLNFIWWCFISDSLKPVCSEAGLWQWLSFVGGTTGLGPFFFFRWV